MIDRLTQNDKERTIYGYTKPEDLPIEVSQSPTSDEDPAAMDPSNPRFSTIHKLPTSLKTTLASVT